MYQFTKIIAFFVFILAGIEAYAAETAVTDPSKVITVARGEPEFAITLKSNPTTGYSWLIKDYDSNLLTVVGHKFNPPDSKLVGAGGIDVWTFKVNKIALAAPHVLTIKMLYAKPWDVKDNATEQEFTVTTHG